MESRLTQRSTATDGRRASRARRSSPRFASALRIGYRGCFGLEVKKGIVLPRPPVLGASLELLQSRRYTGALCPPPRGCSAQGESIGLGKRAERDLLCCLG